MENNGKIINLKKTAFTLVELLGVIILLAAISLIAIPVVLNVVDSAKKAAFKDSVLGIMDAAKIYHISNYPQTSNIEFICDGMQCGTPDEKLSFSGEVPISGKVIINESKISAEYVSNGKYCAYGEVQDLRVVEGCEMFDETAPILDELKMHLTSSSDKIIVHLDDGFAIDDESGILKTVAILYLGNEKIEEKEVMSKDIIFTKLKENTVYSVKIIVYNRASRESSIQKEISTQPIINPNVYQVSQDPENKEYATKRIIKVVYTNTNIEQAEHYIKSTTNFTITEGNIIQSCGQGVEPSDCQDVQNTELSVNTWYKVNNTEIVLSFKTEGNLYTLTSDGTNMVGGSTYNIANMDVGIPTIVPISEEVKYIIGEDDLVQNQFIIKSNGPLPVTTVCKNNGQVVTNLNELGIGDYVINCETTKSNEVKASASIKIKIVSNECNSDTIGEIIGGFICSAPNPNCFTCPADKEKIQLENGMYTCK